jgi:hypothetical protein
MDLNILKWLVDKLWSSSIYDEKLWIQKGLLKPPEDSWFLNLHPLEISIRCFKVQQKIINNVKSKSSSNEWQTESWKTKTSFKQIDEKIRDLFFQIMISHHTKYLTTLKLLKMHLFYDAWNIKVDNTFQIHTAIRKFWNVNIPIN